MNDEGYVALCEGDFHAIPAALLLQNISGKPVFLANPAMPHRGEMLINRCSAPSKLDGINPVALRLLTQSESDFDAAPEVEPPIGMKVTAVNPDFLGQFFLGLRGEIVRTPFHPICR